MEPLQFLPMPRPPDEEPPQSREALGEHMIRLWEETHANVRLIVHMVADIHNVVVYGRRPTKPAIPPNPNAAEIKVTPAGTNPAEWAKVVESLGSLFGKFRR